MGLLAEYIPQGGAVLRFILNYALRLSCDKLRQRFKYCALRLPCAKLKSSAFSFVTQSIASRLARGQYNGNCALRLPCSKLKRSPFNFAQAVVSDVGMELQLYNLSENVV